MRTVFDISQVAWDLRTLREVIRQASDIDTSSSLKDESEALAVVSQIAGSTGVDYSHIRNSSLVRKHFYFTYAVVSTWHAMVEWLEKSGLQITTHQAEREPDAYVLIVSGTLDDWKSCFVRNLHENLKHPKEELFRLQLSDILGRLENRGFAFVFDDYAKRSKNGLLYLKEK